MNSASIWKSTNSKVSTQHLTATDSDNNRVLGDRHFGGLATHFVNISEKSFVSKPLPRVNLWERLFFSDCGFLAELKRNCPESPYCLIETNLKFYSSADREYLVQFIDEFHSLSEPTELELRAVGSLIGLTLAFGMTDLHRRNVVWQGWRCQIVDLECLLWDVRTLSDVGFLSDRSSGKASVLDPLLGYLASVPIARRSSAMNLIAIGILEFLSAVEFDEDIWTDFFGNFSSSRIRVLLRSTAEYAQMRSCELSLEERLQSYDGDVPYFAAPAAKLRCGDVEFYHGGEWKTCLQLPTRSKTDIGRAGRNLKELLESKRLARIAGSAIAQLLNRVGCRDLSISLGRFSIVSSSTELRVTHGSELGRIRFAK